MRSSETMMAAAVTIKAGSSYEAIEIKEVSMPEVKEGWVLIRIKAFGLNRSELYTRRGLSPGVVFPRIQGIECVGLVEEDPSETFKKGQQVAAIMGGMGRAFDGGYAEFTCVPINIIFPFNSSLPWETLGAIPEMFQTSYGSLYQALEIVEGETLLIRGGTSSIGMLTCQLAKSSGLQVVSTTRNPKKKQALLDNGADHVIIDSGNIVDQLKMIYPLGVHKVLELVGTTTLRDSLQCIRTRGVVCMTGMLGDSWTLEKFSPFYDIPSLGRFTIYAGNAKNISKNLLQDFIHKVEKGTIDLNIDRVFRFDEVSDAHQYMEDNLAIGKMVVKI